ncbi:hypothetical protein RHGRI_001782 [Rhododendron griersonianum]|uniref:Transmembrane protein n=1 Tax=Rhododendron griersonianum TaxID=479676 RepID=A0AAV6LMR8_9ERIC|nr:hypothetical protein RHGRI_001782 [Rhododendron griersonianum]
MIHRKWSLLTGPAAILGGIVATVVVANFLFVKNFYYLMSRVCGCGGGEYMWCGGEDMMVMVVLVVVGSVAMVVCSKGGRWWKDGDSAGGGGRMTTVVVVERQRWWMAVQLCKL